MMGEYILLAVLLTLACLCWMILHKVYWDVNYTRLPPGSMGSPLIGETLELAWKRNTTFKPAMFFEKRQARYGPLFKSHLFGEPVIISTSASVNQFVFEKEGELFQCAYPSTFAALMGHKSMGQLRADLHAKLRGLVLRVAGSATLHQYIGDIEASLLKRLTSWENTPVVYLHTEACQIAFDLVVKQLISLTTDDEEAKVLMHSFRNFISGLIAFPINIPWSTYNKCLKGRAKVVEILENIILKRMESDKHTHPRDLLDALLKEEEKDSAMFTRDLTMDVMVSMIFAAYETTATALTFAVKLITEHQDVRDRLMVEHLAIQENKRGENKAITWEEYRSMSYTRDVLYETLRLANIAPFVYREALTDVDIHGYIVPKGWKIIPCLSCVHIDSSNFLDPLNFNPSRWKESSLSKKSFMPFGGGPRLCAGNELSLMEISIFLHHFITKYRWREIGKEHVIRSPGVKFKNGYPIMVEKLHKSIVD